MIQYTTVYEVWGCDTGACPRMDALFIDLKTACKFAVANKGKIGYGLPDVVKKTYSYNPKQQTVDIVSERIPTEQIYYMNKI